MKNFLMTKCVQFAFFFMVAFFVSCESVPDASDSFTQVTQTQVASQEPRQNSQAQDFSSAKTQQIAQAPKTAPQVAASNEQPPLPPPTSEPPEEITEFAFVGKVRDALSSGDMEAALAVFDDMPEDFAQNTGLQLVHASILISAGKYNEAKKIATELEKNDGKNIDVLELNLAVATATNDSRAQRSVMQKILAIDPNNAAVNIRQAEEYAMAHRYQQAGNAYRKVLENDSKNREALFGYAQMSYYLNNIKQAREALEQLLELEPDNAYALAYMGKLYAEDENYLRASQYINRAIDVDSSNYDFFLDQGTYEHYLGHFDAAMASWTKSISLNPDYFLAYVYRAGLYSERSQFSEALADYMNVVRTNPKYYYAYEEIGVLQWREGNWAESRRAFLEGLKYYENNYAYVLMVAATYLKENNRNEMRNYLAKAMRAFKSDSVEYQVMRLYYDNGPVNAENNVTKQVNSEQSTTKKGKLRYYMALYFDLKNSTKLSEELYSQVVGVAAPLFFEYRLAEWGLEK